MLTRRVGFPGGRSRITQPSFGILLTIAPGLALARPYFSLIRGRLLTVLSRIFCGPRFTKLKLVPPSSIGLKRFTLSFRARYLSINLFLIFYHFPAVCDRAAPCVLCCMYWCQRFWPLVCVFILASEAFVSLVLIAMPLSLSMQMTLQ